MNSVKCIVSSFNPQFCKYLTNRKTPITHNNSFKMNETNDDDDERTCLSKIRQILIETKVEPARSRTILELFRRLFSTHHADEKLVDADCEQGNYHEIVPRLFLGD